MPTTTYTLVDSVTLGSNTANVAFESIPATYNDLVLVITGTMAVGTVGHGDIKFNFSTSDYHMQHMDAGASTTIGRAYNGSTQIRFSENNSFSTTTLNTTTIDILRYSSTRYKSLLIRTNRPDGLVAVTAGEWASTSPIDRIVIGGDAAYEAGTTFYLYGIEG